MYKIIISNKASKEIDNLPDRIFLKIDDIILKLKKKPRPVGSIKLTNLEEYRIRIGDYRLLYTIDEKLKEIHIFKVSHRREIYRKK